MQAEQLDPQSGIVLWEQAPLKCRFLTHATEPRFEMRLYTSDVLISREFFSDHAKASQYAVRQMHTYGAADGS